MELVMKEFAEEHLPEMTEIWNDVVEEGISFPGDKALSEKEALRYAQWRGGWRLYPASQ